MAVEEKLRFILSLFKSGKEKPLHMIKMSLAAEVLASDIKAGNRKHP